MAEPLAPAQRPSKPESKGATEAFYFKDAMGQPVKITDPDMAEEYALSGQKQIGKEQAVAGTRAAQDLSYVDQNWGTAGKLGLGALSGLTLGLAPGILAKMGALDPGHIQAAQTSPWYTAGDVAGTLAPALLTGGEAGAARLLAPLDMAGSAAERLAASVLPETPGLLGRLASSPLRMAARGATEGALLNLGHTTGDALVQNKPLAAESLLASGVDGALFGGLVGAGLGTVGAIGSAAVDSAANFAKGAFGKNAASGAANRRAVGTLSRHLGLDEDALKSFESYKPFRSGEAPYASATKEAAGEAAEVGYKPAFKSINAELERGGGAVGESTPKMAEAAKKASAINQAIREEVAESATRVAAQTPSVSRVVGGIREEILRPIANTYDYIPTERALRPIERQLTQIENVPGAPEAYRAGTWKEWLKSRDQIASSSLAPELKQSVLNVVDREIHSSLEAAEAGLGDKLGAATAQLKMSKYLEETLGNKAAKELLTSEPHITPKDMAFMGFGATLGNPVPAMTYVAGRGISRIVKPKLEGWMARMAYESSVGQKAATAQVAAKERIKTTMRNFFKTSSMAPYKAAQVVKAERQKESKESINTRKGYEAAASRAEQLLSQNHQERIRMHANELAQQGYQDLAKALLMVNSRAANYLQWNTPPRAAAKQVHSLRPNLVPFTLTMAEFKHGRILEGVTKPFSILDDLEAGKLSRDKVAAVKYVYPELHSELVQQATEQVMEMKSQGKFLPMDKIVALGTALDAPIDSTLQPEYINNVQMALNSPPPQASPPGGSGPPMPTPALIQQSGMLSPLQTLTA